MKCYQFLGLGQGAWHKGILPGSSCLDMADCHQTLYVAAVYYCQPLPPIPITNFCLAPMPIKLNVLKVKNKLQNHSKPI